MGLDFITSRMDSTWKVLTRKGGVVSLWLKITPHGSAPGGKS